MVAKSGKGWKAAPAVLAFFDQANALAPKRSQIFDGTIGDERHKKLVSDHNPAKGLVLAGDLTHDPARGIDAHAWADRLLAARPPQVKYVISNGRIAVLSKDTTWRKYDPLRNQHRQHTHVSVHASFADATPDWLLTPSGPSVPATLVATPSTVPTVPQEDEMPRPMSIYVVADLGSTALFAVGQDGWCHHIETQSLLEEGQRVGLYARGEPTKVSAELMSSIPRSDVLIEWAARSAGLPI